MNIIEKAKAKIKYRRMRYGAITRQIVPVFHDQWQLSNKTFKEFLLDEEKLSFSSLETQDGVKVEFYKGFNDEDSMNYKRHKGDKNFTWAGFKKGDKFNIFGAGYLESIDYVCEVILVTDSFLYGLNTRTKTMNIYRHEEIELMEKTGGIIRKD